MAKQFTGIDGALYLDGNKVGKITEWSFDGEVDTLECTTLGDFARKVCLWRAELLAVAAPLLYYEADAGAIVGSGLADRCDSHDADTD